MASERERAFGGPRALKEPGSIDWCYQTLDLLKIRWERKEFVLSAWDEVRREIAEHHVWDKFPPDHPYGSEPALYRAEIGVAPDEARREILSHSAAGRLGGRGRKAMDNIHSFNGGADTNYTLARLERDRPDLHAQVMGGALSANSAAVAAGFRTRTMSIPLDPDRAARAILRRFDAAQVVALIEALSSPEAEQ